MLAVGGVLAASVAVALGAADGPGGIAFDNAELAREVGVVALAAILYESGFPTPGACACSICHRRNRCYSVRLPRGLMSRNPSTR